MKRILLLTLLFGLLSSFTNGQEVSREKLLKRKPSTVKKYDTTFRQANQYFLNMDFAEAKILNPKEHFAFMDKQVERVELYYTDFRLSDSFQQSKLNGKRLEELEKLIPSIYQQSGIVWRFVVQTGAKDEEAAKTYFHGFVITYRDLAFVDRETELVRMDSVSIALSAIKDTIYSIECRNMSKTRKKWTGYYLPNNPDKAEKGIRFRRKGIWKRKREYQTLVKTNTICDTIWGVTGTFGGSSLIVDSTVMQVLERNMTKWKKSAIITDVTGSMYPYVLQLQVWMRLNYYNTDCRHFVFFNDGDMKIDRLKRIGKVGGIYPVHAANYTAMELTCKKAMKNGGGSDAQENDLEAILEAQKQYPDRSSFILIADNYAPVRDMALLKKIKKPVHVILCGTQSGYINVEYLEIAHQTGGSVHTIERDIENLAEMSEGAKIEIGGITYQIQRGKFVIVRGS